MSQLTNGHEREKCQVGLDWTVLLGQAVDERSIALAVREGHTWREWSYGQLKKGVISLSSYLIENGVERGDRVAILAESRPEWAIVFLAAFRCSIAGAGVGLASFSDGAMTTCCFFSSSSRARASSA